MYTHNTITLYMRNVLYGYYICMRDFIFIRVVIGYGLGVIASCHSSTVVPPFPPSFSAGFSVVP